MHGKIQTESFGVRWRRPPLMPTSAGKPGVGGIWARYFIVGPFAVLPPPLGRGLLFEGSLSSNCYQHLCGGSSAAETLVTAHFCAVRIG